MTQGNTKKILTISIIAVAIFFAVHNNVSAFEYKLLEAFPGFFSKGSSPNLPDMILAIYKFGIWTVGICGLLMITIGGVMYMGSAGNNANAESAKRIITDSLIGIVAALGAYLFMYVINPDLTIIKLSLTTAKTATTTSSEASETSAESAGTLTSGTAGSCGGLATQTNINKQCPETSSELSGLLTCISGKLPGAIITSISDSKGYANCIPLKWTSSCAHSKNSCHYGGPSCYATGKSYAVDISTRNLSASSIKSAAKECGASYIKDESSSANHIHASVGKIAGCGCN